MLNLRQSLEEPRNLMSKVNKGCESKMSGDVLTFDSPTRVKWKLLHMLISFTIVNFI